MTARVLVSEAGIATFILARMSVLDRGHCRTIFPDDCKVY